MSRLIIVGGGEIAEAIYKTIDSDILTKQDINVKDPELRWHIDAYYDAAIYTAGVSHPKALGESFLEHIKEELDVNLYGAFNFARSCIKNNIETMIFIGSIAGLYGKPNHAGYCASKAGVRSLVQSLAMEGYNAYNISPGRVNTKMRQKDYPNEHPETRLKTYEIAHLVRDILDGEYQSGDNIIIRRIGHETQPIVVDKGDGWKEVLKVGEPVVC